MIVTFEPTVILAADPDRTPLSITNLGDKKVKLILNQIAGVGGSSVEVNLPAGATTTFDGGYKGQIWAKTLKEGFETELQINTIAEEAEE